MLGKNNEHTIEKTLAKISVAAGPFLNLPILPNLPMMTKRKLGYNRGIGKHPLTRFDHLLSFHRLLNWRILIQAHFSIYGNLGLTVSANMSNLEPHTSCFFVG